MTSHCSSNGQPTLNFAHNSSVLCSPSNKDSSTGGNGAAVCGMSCPTGAEGDLENLGRVTPSVERPPLECSLSRSVPAPMSGDILRLENCGDAARRVGKGVGSPAPRCSSGARRVGGGPMVLVLPARMGRVIREVVANLLVGSWIVRLRSCSNDISAALDLLTGRYCVSAGFTATSSAPADVMVGTGSCRRPRARDWSGSGRMTCMDCAEVDLPRCRPIRGVMSIGGTGCVSGGASKTGQRCTLRRNPCLYVSPIM